MKYFYINYSHESYNILGSFRKKDLFEFWFSYVNYTFENKFLNQKSVK
jgi:hypothetical protein